MPVTFKSTGVGPTIKTLASATLFSAAANPRTRVITSGSTTTAAIKDANVQTSTTATTASEFDLSVNIPLTSSQSYSIINLTPGVASITGNSGTWLANGTATVNVVSTVLGTQQISHAVSEQVGQSTTTFSSFAPGSLAAAICSTVDGLLSGKTASATTYDLLASGGARNSSLWASGIDFSCLAVNVGGGNEQHGGTLVSPQHILLANHFSGISQVNFLASDGSTVNRTVTALQEVGTTDLCIGYLNSAVPSTVGFARVLPSNFRSYLPSVQYGVPTVFANQYKELHVGEWNADPAAAEVAIASPKVSSRQPWYAMPISGDSGSPNFLVIGGALVVLTCWHTAGGGPNPADNIAGINSVMASLQGGGSPHQLTVVSLSGYPSY
jgi:hypothetical protein